MSAQPARDDDLPTLTTQEVADMLRLNVGTIREKISRGELPAYKVAGKLMLVPGDVRAYAFANPVAVTAVAARAEPSRRRRVSGGAGSVGRLRAIEREGK